MTDLAYQNQLAADTGGRSYLTVPRETDAERARRLEQEALDRLASRLRLADAAATPPSLERPDRLAAEYEESSIRDMAKARSISYQTMYKRLKAAGVTFKPVSYPRLRDP